MTERLEQARVRLSPSGKTRFKQLVHVFQWCEEHSVELAELRVPDNLHKYREAATYLNDIRESENWEALKTAIETIKAHKTRDETRAWMQSQQEAKQSDVPSGSV